jgi:hypothetical protein
MVGRAAGRLWLFWLDALRRCLRRSWKLRCTGRGPRALEVEHESKEEAAAGDRSPLSSPFSPLVIPFKSSKTDRALPML